MRSLVAVLLALVAPLLAAGALADDSQHLLPNHLGPHLLLGMPVDKFSATTGMQPTRCASCTHGELMAEPPATIATEAVIDLGAFDLTATKDLKVECYFEGSHLQSIIARGLSGRDPLTKLTRRFGMGHTLQSGKDVRETEWLRGHRRLRLSEEDGLFDVILSENP
jgi:hypothetical protein